MHPLALGEGVHPLVGVYPLAADAFIGGVHALPHGQNDRHVCKHYLPHTSYVAVINSEALLQRYVK